MKESTVLNWTKSDKLEENEKRLNNDKRKQSRSKMYGGRYEALTSFSIHYRKSNHTIAEHQAANCIWDRCGLQQISCMAFTNVIIALTAKSDTLNYYKSIRPGRDTVVKIRALKYDPSGKIYYKLRHTDPWDQLNQRVKLSPSRPTQSLPNMYQERRKIKKEKYDHLKILKKTLLQDYHTFYDNLPYEEN
ncbi:unnamed protein product [Acanthoscelides obtectus]|uniref:Uncharacterized protein n=1 Tax=Acanthoscelides obtectus TaxID=200917 RepID=A0A9P0JTV7_ACAOB|nr:unnamed protein product [Acanthoscelides obtectus]CAK1689190.1 hypothetical protein AOBTE_LOCUS37065 [Acanthoscelides obtectus]